MRPGITRREVLTKAGQTAAAAAIGVLPVHPGAEARQSQPGPNDRITAALIGCGGMGRGNMSNLIRHGGRIAAVCDVDSSHMAAAAQQAAKEQGGATPDQVKDFRRLLERKDIQAVIIATPDHWHCLPTLAACEAGKDIYLEKPISHNIAEGRAMVAAARRYKTVVQVGTWQRSTKDFVDAIAYVRSGKLGRVTQVKAWKTDWFCLGKTPDQPVPAELDWDFYLGPAAMVPYTGKNAHFNWRWYFNTAAGNTGDWGVHMIDIGLLAMSPGTDLVMPHETASFGGKFTCGEDDARTTPDTQTAILRFKDFVLTWTTGRRGLEYGYQRQVPAGDGGPQRPPQDLLDNGTAFIAADGKSLVVWRGGWTVRDAQGNELPKTTDESFGHYDHMRDWLECIQARRQPRSNLASMYQTTAVCHLANIAYLSGEVIRWDKEKDDIAGRAGKETLPYAREYRKPWKLPPARG